MVRLHFACSWFLVVWSSVVARNGSHPAAGLLQSAHRAMHTHAFTSSRTRKATLGVWRQIGLVEAWRRCRCRGLGGEAARSGAVSGPPREQPHDSFETSRQPNLHSLLSSQGLPYLKSSPAIYIEFHRTPPPSKRATNAGCAHSQLYLVPSCLGLIEG